MWFKVDDGFHASHKVLRIPRSVRLPAIGLWTLTGAWSAANELDGFVPDFVIEEFGGQQKHVDALVKSGLWIEVPDGSRFSKWAEYQYTREQLDAKRAKDAERKANQRARHGGVTVGHDADTAVTESGSALPVPSRPVPTRPETSNTDQSCPVSDRANDSDKTDQAISAIKENLAHYLNLDAADDEIGAWSRFVVANSKQPVRDVKAYCLSSIYKYPDEVQQWFDDHRKPRLRAVGNG